MNAIQAAVSLGVAPEAAKEYLSKCADVVESGQYVATLKGNTVHLAANVKGLGGRKLLRECRATLYEWFKTAPILYAPVKHGNIKAVRMAKALGFAPYDTTPTHIWLLQTKEHFDGH